MIYEGSGVRILPDPDPECDSSLSNCLFFKNIWSLSCNKILSFNEHYVKLLIIKAEVIKETGEYHWIKSFKFFNLIVYSHARFCVKVCSVARYILCVCNFCTCSFPWNKKYFVIFLMTSIIFIGAYIAEGTLGRFNWKTGGCEVSQCGVKLASPCLAGLMELPSSYMRRWPSRWKVVKLRIIWPLVQVELDFRVKW